MTNPRRTIVTIEASHEEHDQAIYAFDVAVQHFIDSTPGAIPMFRMVELSHPTHYLLTQQWEYLDDTTADSV